MEKVNYPVHFAVLLIPGLLGAAPGNWTWLNPLPQGNTLFCVQFLGNDTGFAAGDGGTILKTTDGGGSWSNTSIPQASQFHWMDFHDIMTGAIISYGAAAGQPNNVDRIFRTSDGGATWIPMKAGLQDYSALQWIDDKTLVVGGDSTLLVARNGGIGWDDPVRLGASVTALSFPNAQSGFVMGSKGGLGVLYRASESSAGMGTPSF
jgi:photosystem II stability/assembly factor-like uncharacterized protein